MLNQLVKRSEREKSGLTDSYDRERLRPIKEHLTGYEASLRHSDINLTMNAYTMLEVYDQTNAVASLPPLPAR